MANLIADQANEYAAKVVDNIGDLIPSVNRELMQSLLAVAWVEGLKVGGQQVKGILSE